MLLELLVATLSIVAAVQNCEQVNSFIATNGLGYGYGGVNPGAQVPFGALRLGPDTTTYIADMTWRHFSGYNYQDHTIRAFSHTHLVGGGVNDLGSVGVMPLTVGKKDQTSFPHNSWWSDFNKTTETASPGFYSVYLNEPKTKVELMAISNLAGVHRYTWDSLTTTTNPALVIDMCHDSKIHKGEDDTRCLDASFNIDTANSNVFTGHVHTKGGLSNGMILYIYAELHSENEKDTSSLVDSWRVCTKDSKTPTCQEDINTITASQRLYSIAHLNKKLTKSSLSVDLRVGISFISIDQAKLNLQAALGSSADFSSLAARTKEQWCESMNFISITGLDSATDPDFTTIFYSAIYRSFMSPTDYTEVNGLYLGVDRQVHNVTADRLAYGDDATTRYASHWFSDLSFWDTFRTQHPWLFLVNEDLSVGLARSIADITVQQNAFPRWVLGAHEASCMLGEHGAAFIVEMLAAGLGKTFDIQSIKDIFLPQSVTSWPLNGRTDVQRYLDEGYVSQDVSSDAAVETITNAFDDFLLGKICEYVGDQDSATAAFQRSKNYAVIWSPESKIFCPKYADGTLACPSDPAGLLSWQYYREGDGYHYAWFVPHDPEGLLALYNSPNDFNEALSQFLENHVPYFDKFGNAVPNPYYWAGNEHDHLAPWLFNIGPNCTNTQYWTRKLTYMHYSNTPHGIPGNEDYGAMSSWFIFTSLGIYPQAGTTRFFIGAPRVKEAKITLTHWNEPRTTVLTILTENNSVENTYIDKLLVNGQVWDKPYLDRSVLTSGDVTLQFFMHNTPTSSLCSV